MNTNVSNDSKGTPPTSFPKFPDLDSLLKELVCLRSIKDSIEKRMLEIIDTLTEARQQLEHSLRRDFNPPPSSDADMQKVMTSVGNLVKSSGTTALGSQTNGAAKVPAATTGTDAK